MTEQALVAREERTPAATGVTMSAMQLTTMDDAFRLARAIAQSGMTPKAYGQDENKVFVGILAGAEVGLAPMQSLQSIAVINGNPSLWGDGALALIQASGLLEDIEETDDGNEATCRLVRKGSPTPIVRRFNMDDAKKAGLAGKSGPWSQYPARMRQMRARSWAMRDGFADVLKGLRIYEEVRDHPEMVADQPKTQKLSSQMLAEQAGETVDAEPIDEVDQTPPEEAEVAQQTLKDIDGPLEEEKAPEGPESAEEKEGAPDPREATYERIRSEIKGCTTLDELGALSEREKNNIAALTDEQQAVLNRCGEEMTTAIKRKAGNS